MIPKHLTVRFKTRMWRPYLGLVSVACLSVLVGCSKQSSREAERTNKSPFDRQLKRLRVGHLPITAELPIFVAKEMRYFEQAGLDVQLKEFSSANDVMNALMAGQIDIAGVQSYPSIFAVEAENPGQLRLYLSADETETNYGAAILVPTNSTVRDLGGLRGKRLGTYSGLGSVAVAKAVLAKVGLHADKDVEIIQLPHTSVLQGLAAGKFDALLALEPYVTIGREKGIGRELVPAVRVKYLMDPFPSMAYPVSASFVKANPDVLRRYVRAIDRAIAMIKSEPAAQLALLPKYTPVEPEIAPKVHLYNWLALGEERKDAVQQIADRFYDWGVIKKQVDVKELFLPAGFAAGK